MATRTGSPSGMTPRGIFAIKINPKRNNNAIVENTRGMLREKNKASTRPVASVIHKPTPNVPVNGSKRASGVSTWL